MTDETTAKPCHSCGADPDSYDTAVEGIRVRCSIGKCFMSEGLFDLEDWNTRHTPAAVAELVKCSTLARGTLAESAKILKEAGYGTFSMTIGYHLEYLDKALANLNPEPQRSPDNG